MSCRGTESSNICPTCGVIHHILVNCTCRRGSDEPHRIAAGHYVVCNDCQQKKRSRSR